MQVILRRIDGIRFRYKMDCNICPLNGECSVARGVAIRSLGNDENEVLNRLRSICPLKEIVYTTFRLAVPNIRRSVSGNE